MAAIIFDFDGTIADSFDYVVNFLATEGHHAFLSTQQKHELHSMSMRAMAQRLGCHWWQLPGLLMKGRRQMNGVITHIKPFSGMPSLIEKLHAEGHELFILSSNSVRNVRMFLHHHNLQTYFLEVYGGISLFGKAPALRRLLRDQNLEIKDAVYIGDELRDVQAAQSLKLSVVAVSWGFARRQHLANLHPTGLADQPQELLSILEEI